MITNYFLVDITCVVFNSPIVLHHRSLFFKQIFYSSTKHKKKVTWRIGVYIFSRWFEKRLFPVFFSYLTDCNQSCDCI